MTKKNKLIHTPEGVRDIYNGECRRKLAEDPPYIISAVMAYPDPKLEYADICEPWKCDAREMFKFSTGTITCWYSGRI